MSRLESETNDLVLANRYLQNTTATVNINCPDKEFHTEPLMV